MSLGKSALWATVGNWIQQGFSLLTILVLARLLEPAMFGVMATALLLLLLGQRILLEGVSYFVIQLETINDEVLSAAFWFASALGLVLACLLVAFAQPLASLFNTPPLADVLPILAAIPILDGLASIHTGLLRRESQFRTLAKRTLFAGTLGCAAGIAVALLGGGIWALVVQQLVQSVGNCTAAVFSHSWRPRAVFSLTSFQRLVRFAVPMGGNAVVYVALNRVDVALLSGFAGPAATGIYSMAKRLARAVTDLLVTGVSAAGLTSMSAAKSDRHEMQQTLNKSVALAAWLSFPAFALMGWIGPAALPVLLGSKWSEVGQSLMTLCLFGVIQVPVLVGSNVFVALGQTSRLAMQSALSLLVFLGAALLLRPFNAASISLAFLIQGVAAAVIFAFQLPSAGQSPRSVIRSLLGSLVAATVGLLSLWALEHAPLTPMPRLLDYALQVMVFVVVYLGMSFVCARNELNMVLKRVRGRAR